MRNTVFVFAVLALLACKKNTQDASSLQSAPKENFTQRDDRLTSPMPASRDFQPHLTAIAKAAECLSPDGSVLPAFAEDGFAVTWGRLEIMWDTALVEHAHAAGAFFDWMHKTNIEISAIVSRADKFASLGEASLENKGWSATRDCTRLGAVAAARIFSVKLKERLPLPCVDTFARRQGALSTTLYCKTMEIKDSDELETAFASSLEHQNANCPADFVNQCKDAFLKQAEREAASCGQFTKDNFERSFITLQTSTCN